MWAWLLLLLFLFFFLLRDGLLPRLCAAHHDGHGGVSPPYACSFRSCRSRLGHLLVVVAAELSSIFLNFFLAKKKRVYFSVPGGARKRWVFNGLRAIGGRRERQQASGRERNCS